MVVPFCLLNCVLIAVALQMLIFFLIDVDGVWYSHNFRLAYMDVYIQVGLVNICGIYQFHFITANYGLIAIMFIIIYYLS